MLIMMRLKVSLLLLKQVASKVTLTITSSPGVTRHRAEVPLAQLFALVEYRLFMILRRIQPLCYGAEMAANMVLDPMWFCL